VRILENKALLRGKVRKLPRQKNSWVDTGGLRARENVNWRMGPRAGNFITEKRKEKCSTLKEIKEAKVFNRCGGKIDPRRGMRKKKSCTNW